MRNVTEKSKIAKVENQNRLRKMSEAFAPALLIKANLTCQQFRVWFQVKYRGECWESIDSMAKYCRLDRKTVMAALKELTSRGFLSKTKRRGQTSVYRVTDGPGVSNGAGNPGCRTGDKGTSSKGKEKKETADKSARAFSISKSDVTIFEDFGSRSRQTHVTDSEASPDLKAVTGSERANVPRRRRPASVAEVLEFALTRHRDYELEQHHCKTSEVKAWLEMANLDEPASKLLECAGHNEYIHETLRLALRFIHYNNRKGWKLKNNWRAAYDGFEPGIVENSAGVLWVDVPTDWIPHVAGVDGRPEEEETVCSETN